MDFLGIGPLELLFILIIIFIVIGPNDISKTARAIGRFLNRMYKSEEWRTLTQASQTLRTLPNRLAREAELEELKEVEETIKETRGEIDRQAQSVREETKGVEEGMRVWAMPPSTGPSAAEEPTPAEMDTQEQQAEAEAPTVSSNSQTSAPMIDDTSETEDNKPTESA